jgi:hypothetical protein
MKLFDDKDMTTGTVKGFGFSAVRPETLGASEYTLVTVVMDKTGSVSGFAQALFALKETIVQACRKSPRAEYLLLRFVEFNTSVDEVHGFKPLADIDTASYTVPMCNGGTALFDATYSGVAATTAYATTLTDQDYLVNGIVIIATDGDDNASRMRPADIATAIKAAMTGEQLESLRTILVGINAAQYRNELEAFKTAASIDQYVDVADASPQRLAKLADFVSRSISAQSQSLGTGGPSQALVF